jgi:hypothetical protein
MGRIIAGVTVVTAIIVILVISTQFITISIKQDGSHRVTVERKDATFVNTLINIPTGSLALTSDASKLMEGEFTYEQPQWDAQAAYSLDNGIGSLNIIQPITFRSPASIDGYSYHLSLSPDVPMALDIERTLGPSDLTLDDLQLTTVEANLGSGDDSLHLNGDQPNLSAINVSTGAGKDTVAMNCTCAMLGNIIASLGQENDSLTLAGSYPNMTSVNVDGSLGDDQISLTGDYPSVSTMTLNLGTGSDSLTLNGSYPKLSALIINVGAGDDIVDLSGSWTHDVNIMVISESNTTSLQLPADVGVFVEIFGTSAQVNAEGFTAQDNGYVNAAYGKSDVTLRINLNTSTVETVTLTLRQ